MTNKKKIYVTKPFLPPLEEFMPYLQKIWGSGTLTNNGPFHQELENELCKYLNVPYVSLFSNGTLALLTALQALHITGEVITTPFSFVATTHALWWNNITPVFVDIEPTTLTLDPKKLEAAITPKTTAILPVHVYGHPCNIEAIQEIADRRGLKVIYDAAHTFGARYKEQSMVAFGDMSILSFHATKVFNTFEGGAIVSHSVEMKRHIDDLKNFGFRDEVTVVAPGINAKMNEVQAAMGLLQLKYIDNAIEKRKLISTFYREQLIRVKGIGLLPLESNVQYNYSYFPIFVDDEVFGMNRDQLYEKLKENHIYGRRYFYPLISQFSTYQGLPSAAPSNLKVAEDISRKVLCLPIFPDIRQEDLYNIVNLINHG